MCGIAGIVKLRNSTVNISLELKRMCDAIRHRGPDDEGYVFFNDRETVTSGSTHTPEEVWESSLSYSPTKEINDIEVSDFSIGLGHRRLSILDLTDAGHEPMSTSEGDHWLTFNGEIYNYLELKEYLQKKGHSFFTGTDTEVILHAYREWGYNCVDHFNGMWAFTLYDRKKNIIWGSRDRTGVKPFYYFLNNEHFAFASEQKAFLELSFYSRATNEKAVFDFFVLDKLENEPEGFYKGIFELFPSHSFELNLNIGKFHTWKYYHPEINYSHEKPKQEKFNMHVERIKALVRAAVNLRLRSDVPVGSCLSGGLDSSSIVCLMSELEKPQEFPLKVFTAAFEDPIYDESKWAKLTAQKAGAEWHKVFPTSEDLIADLEDLTKSQDIPLWSTSTYAQYRVMKTASTTGVKVVLDGQGGDELFSGYLPHHAAWWMELTKHYKFGELSKSLKLFDSMPRSVKFFFREYLKHSGQKHLPYQLRHKLAKVYFNELKYLNPDFLSSYKEDTEKYLDNLNQVLAHQYFGGSLKRLLRCEDRSSMRFSLESRTPFSDDLPLMTAAFQIPGSYKIYKGELKNLLRSAMKGIIPEAVRQRKDKMGFLTPNDEWVEKIWKPVLEKHIPNHDPFINLELLKKDAPVFFAKNSFAENYRKFKFISYFMWRNS